MTLTDPFANHSKVFLQQRKEWAEILVDWETRNQYTLRDEHGGELGTLSERAGGLWSFFRRGFLRSHRGFEAALCDRTGQIVLVLQRNFFLLFSDLEIRTPEGRLLGRVRRRFGVLYKRYDLLDATEACFARIAGPRWRLWTFPVESTDGQLSATITKRWGGGLREIFSDADTFLIDFQSPRWRPDQRAVLFGAAISIDFDFFENNQGSGGVLGGIGD
jgi:uncharacterized protein YxjI